VKVGANKIRDKNMKNSCYTGDGEKMYIKVCAPDLGAFFYGGDRMHISEEEYLRLEREGIQKY
jgi:hypothetical protein